MARTALAALIDETLAHNGWNDRDVCRRARAGGHILSPSDISLWRVQGMAKLISPAKMLALADGMHVPVHVVARAILSDHGIIVPVDIRSPEDAIRQDHTIAVHTRDQILVLLANDRESPH